MTTATLEHLPVAVIGAGPVGLAAAAHLLAHGLAVKVYEAGPSVASNLRDWGHVRVFTPWRYCVDAAATALLARRGWRMPDADAFPTGGNLVSAYLEPLATTPELTAVIETNVRVTAISRHGLDKVVSREREARPFVLIVKVGASIRRDLPRAVLLSLALLVLQSDTSTNFLRGRMLILRVVFLIWVVLVPTLLWLLIH